MQETLRISDAKSAATNNPRHNSAKEFAFMAAKRGTTTVAELRRALRSYLDARDIAYPREAKCPVNLRQCIAIFLVARPHERTHRNKAS